MKKKLIIPLTVIIVIAIIMFLYEEGTHHLIKPSSTNILIETSCQNNQTKEYKGTLIYENGSIFTYKDNINNITKKRCPASLNIVFLIQFRNNLIPF